MGPNTGKKCFEIVMILQIGFEVLRWHKLQILRLLFEKACIFYPPRLLVELGAIKPALAPAREVVEKVFSCLAFRSGFLTSISICDHLVVVEVWKVTPLGPPLRLYKVPLQRIRWPLYVDSLLNWCFGHSDWRRIALCACRWVQYHRALIFVANLDPHALKNYLLLLLRPDSATERATKLKWVSSWLIEVWALALASFELHQVEVVLALILHIACPWHRPKSWWHNHRSLGRLVNPQVCSSTLKSQTGARHLSPCRVPQTVLCKVKLRICWRVFDLALA